MAKSDTDVLHSNFIRSMSAPSGVDSFQDDTVIDLMKIHRYKQKVFLSHFSSILLTPNRAISTLTNSQSAII